MSKLIISAAGGAMSAEGQNVRRMPKRSQSAAGDRYDPLAPAQAAPGVSRSSEMNKIVDKSQLEAAATVGSALGAGGENHVGDEALFALLEEMATADKRSDAACDEKFAAEVLYRASRPRRPANLCEDRTLFSALMRDERYDEEAIAEIQRLIEIAGPPRDDDPPFARRFKERAREIVAEWRLYLDADDAAREAAGLHAAEERNDIARASLRRLYRRVVDMPAASVAGAMAKIAAVANLFNEEEPDGDLAVADDVLFSAVRDIARLAPQAERDIRRMAAQSTGIAPQRRGDVQRRAPVEADPVFAAIERHRAAERAWVAAEDECDLSRASRSGAAAALGEELEAFHALVTQPPATVEGMRLMIEYIVDVCNRRDAQDDLVTLASTLLKSPVLQA